MTPNAINPNDLFRIEAEARRLRAVTVANWARAFRLWVSRQFKAAPDLRPTA